MNLLSWGLVDCRRIDEHGWLDARRFLERIGRLYEELGCFLLRMLAQMWRWVLDSWSCFLAKLCLCCHGTCRQNLVRGAWNRWKKSFHKWMAISRKFDRRHRLLYNSFEGWSLILLSEEALDQGFLRLVAYQVWLKDLWLQLKPK